MFPKIKTWLDPGTAWILSVKLNYTNNNPKHDVYKTHPFQIEDNLRNILLESSQSRKRLQGIYQGELLSFLTYCLKKVILLNIIQMIYIFLKYHWEFFSLTWNMAWESQLLVSNQSLVDDLASSMPGVPNKGVWVDGESLITIVSEVPGQGPDPSLGHQTGVRSPIKPGLCCNEK